MNIWLFALSVAYAKRLNASIVLHTDTLGEKILGVLPYDEIHVSLNNISTSEYFWATGKIIAQSLEPLGSIHIDGDVFLKKNGLKTLLDFSGFEVLVQNEERINKVYLNHLKTVETYCKNITETDESAKRASAFNCGVLGFNNQEIKDIYINNYLNAVKLCSANKRFMKLIRRNKDTFIPDLILEQKSLGEILYKNAAKVKMLLPDADTIQPDAVRIGFTHLLGKSKYDLIEKVKERLLETDPALYEITNKQAQQFKLL